MVLARQKAAQLGLNKNKSASNTTGAHLTNSTTPLITNVGSTTTSITVSAAETTTSVSAAVASAGLTLAEQAAEKLHAKLGYSKQNITESDPLENVSVTNGTETVRRLVLCYKF